MQVPESERVSKNYFGISVVFLLQHHTQQHRCRSAGVSCGRRWPLLSIRVREPQHLLSLSPPLLHSVSDAVVCLSEEMMARICDSIIVRFLFIHFSSRMLTARSLVLRLAVPMHRALYHANVIDHYENPRNVCYHSTCNYPCLRVSLT